MADKPVPVISTNLMTPPPVFNGEPKHFTIWQEHFKAFLHLSKVTEEEDKRAMLVCSLSMVMQQTLLALIAPYTIKDLKYDDLLAKLEGHFKLTPIMLAEYYKFFTALRPSGMTYSEYAIHLCSLAADCAWPIELDRALAVGITMGIKDDKLRQQLLLRDHASLNNALAQAKQFESIMREWMRGSSHPMNSSELSLVNQVRGRGKRDLDECDWCGSTNHNKNECKFCNVICNACSKTGHIALMCRSKPSAPHNPPQGQQNNSQKRGKRNGYNSKMNQVTFDIDAIHVLSNRGTPSDSQHFEVALQVKGCPARLEFDMGAAITLINEALWRELDSPRLEVSAIICRSVTSQQIPLMGQATVNVIYNGKSARLKMLVTSKCDNVMGQPWTRALQISDLNALHSTESTPSNVLQLPSDGSPASSPTSTTTDKLLNDFPEVFEPGLGHCTKVKAHLELKEGARPRFLRARPLPFAVCDATMAEIDRLVQLGVISQIDYSDWAAPVVIVAKPEDKIRLCADFATGLNDAIDLHHYPLPRPEDLFHRLNGAVMFSKIDFSDAYLQVELDDKSKRLAVINTHKGLFQYLRLPFGISSALAIFQQIMEKMLVGILGVGINLDDMIVLSRIAEYGFRVRKEKCIWSGSSVEYLGFIIDAKGRHTLPMKTRAVINMPPPTNLHELRSFLGMINYYSQFLPSLLGRLAPLHALLKKDESGRHSAFDWTPACQHAFREVKQDLGSLLMLTHYDLKLPIVLTANASLVGVGAVISHRLPDGRKLPIAHTSKTLTPTEGRYPQIKKEALALVFGMQKFHQYLWGRHFILQMDHKPLVTIYGSKKGLPTTSANRLQNYAVTLMSYSFDIEYISTDEFARADGLSHLPLKDDSNFDHSEQLNAALRAVFAERLLDSPVKAKDIANATKKDMALQFVMKLHRTGWPKHLSTSYPSRDAVLPFFCIRHELAIAHNCLLWGLRTIIPTSLRPRMLAQLHTLHPGKNAMQRLAWRHFWWPNLDADVAKTASECDACNQVLPETLHVPLKQWPIAERPWQ
uniref:RNA-directed DNA polymerase n=1 Tax=Plectus sambesii TaxID=2011161 RepID=A0A914X065_9BILA